MIQSFHQLSLGTRGFFLACDEELRRPSYADTSRHFLILFRLGGGRLFEPPLRQNRDNSYTERAMTFKFSDFS